MSEKAQNTGNSENTWNSEKIERIDNVFRLHDETARMNKMSQTSEIEAETPAPDASAEKKSKRSNSSSGKRNIKVSNFTGDETTERDFRPVRQSHEYSSGIISGMMYFAFVVCVSIILACVAWMAASDALALNKENFTVTVSLPSTAFETKTVDVVDEDGHITGTERVTTADIQYVSSTLKDAGLIEYKWLFELFCSISHAENKINPGTYELKSKYDYWALVQNMRSNAGGSLTVTVTIPEGYSMHQIFMKLDESGVCSYDDLMEAAANGNYKYSFLEGSESGDATRLEGYLFPDTYEFYVGMQASSAINKFLENFNNKFNTEMATLADNRGYTVSEIITIASLIEKEAAVDPTADIDERSTVASVIYNRIKAGMSLGLESSILYLYPEHEGAPTAEMLNEDTPYNTNINTGLPPTPICNPGLASINAALNPEKTGYYYFTLDTDTGAHRFFTNYNEFIKFVSTQNYG